MTDIPAILASLGFTASVVNDKKSAPVIKAWTDKGWAYERFSQDVSEDDVKAWAADKAPGA